MTIHQFCDIALRSFVIACLCNVFVHLPRGVRFVFICSFASALAVGLAFGFL